MFFFCLPLLHHIEGIVHSSFSISIPSRNGRVVYIHKYTLQGQSKPFYLKWCQTAKPQFEKGDHVRFEYHPQEDPKEKYEVQLEIEGKSIKKNITPTAENRKRQVYAANTHGLSCIRPHPTFVGI